MPRQVGNSSQNSLNCSRNVCGLTGFINKMHWHTSLWLHWLPNRGKGIRRAIYQIKTSVIHNSHCNYRPVSSIFLMKQQCQCSPTRPFLRFIFSVIAAMPQPGKLRRDLFSTFLPQHSCLFQCSVLLLSCVDVHEKGESKGEKKEEKSAVNVRDDLI